MRFRTAAIAYYLTTFLVRMKRFRAARDGKV
jgi:hypothetical protein